MVLLLLYTITDILIKIFNFLSKFYYSEPQLADITLLHGLVGICHFEWKNIFHSKYTVICVMAKFYAEQLKHRGW